MSERQLVIIGVNLATTIFNSIAWKEPLSGDEMETIIKSFVAELSELNGESEDLFVQKILAMKKTVE